MMMYIMLSLFIFIGFIIVLIDSWVNDPTFRELIKEYYHSLEE